MKINYDKQYIIRKDTDRFFEYGKITCTGIIDKSIRMIEAKQLKNSALWSLLAKQFGAEPDSDEKGWRGEYWGKLMRGAAMIYKYTRDEGLYRVLESTVRDLLQYQDEYGRFSTYSREKEFCGWDMWSRKYVMLGFLHFYEICENETLKNQIQTALERHLDYIIKFVGPEKKSITDTAEMFGGLSASSVLEPVVRMYNLTGKREYLDFASYIVENGGAKSRNIFELAYADELAPYEYSDINTPREHWITKAYEIMSCFEGLIEYYRVTKEEKWLVAAKNFTKRLIETEISIIGCAGCEHEFFDNAAVTQTQKPYGHLMQETCVTVTWMKLCYQLLCLTGESIYAEQIEKSYYNALLGSLNTEGRSCPPDAFFGGDKFPGVYAEFLKNNDNTGWQMFDSYSPLKRGLRGQGIGGFRDMENGTKYFGCCIAIAAAGFGLFPKCAVMSMDNGIAFSMYTDGEFVAESGDDILGAVIKTGYPLNGNVEITLRLKKAFLCEILFRIPDFAEDFEININGATAVYDVKGGYAVVNRTWSDGDKISIAFKMKPRLVISRDQEYAAITRGPIVFARDARLCNLDEKLKITDGNIILEPSKKADFDVMCEFNVHIDDNEFTMIDYASAGKTWDKESETEAWIPTEK